ncbi:MAG: hypothetical protein HC840_01155 [Leptolyngbyaceae cyanobacterium RM2_2_4]|nr:hypothetical protein [Leptolyngbyaceae cyanobacterium RM2_2_4]
MLEPIGLNNFRVYAKNTGFKFVRHNGRELAPGINYNSDLGSIPGVFRWSKYLTKTGYTPVFVLHDFPFEVLILIAAGKLRKEDYSDGDKFFLSFEENNWILLEGLKTLHLVGDSNKMRYKCPPRVALTIYSGVESFVAKNRWNSLLEAAGFSREL